MHVVDGDLLKAARNQRPVLHIQHFIEQHHQQIIQKLFPLHAPFTSAQKLICVPVYHISGRGATTDDRFLPGAKESKPLFLQMQIHTSESFLAKFPCLPEPLHNFDVRSEPALPGRCLPGSSLPLDPAP